MSTLLEKKSAAGLLLRRASGEKSWTLCYVVLEGSPKALITLSLNSKDVSTFTATHLTWSRRRWESDANTAREVIPAKQISGIKYVGFGEEFSLVRKDFGSLHYKAPSEKSAQQWVRRLNTAVNKVRIRSVSEQVHSSRPVLARAASQKQKSEPFNQLLAELNAADLEVQSVPAQCSRSNSLPRSTSALPATPIHTVQNTPYRSNACSERNKPRPSGLPSLPQSDRARGYRSKDIRAKLRDTAQHSSTVRNAISLAEEIIAGKRSIELRTDAKERLMRARKALPRVLVDVDASPSVRRTSKSESTERFLLSCFKSSRTLHHQLVRDFDDTAMKQLVSRMYRVEAEKGETVVEIGQPWDQFFVIQSGVFFSHHIPNEDYIAYRYLPQEKKTSPASCKALQGRLEMGKWFGETCLLMAEFSELEVTCAARGVLWGMTKELFASVIDGNNQRRLVYKKSFLNTILLQLERMTKQPVDPRSSLQHMEFRTYAEKESVFSFKAGDGFEEIIYCCSGSLTLVDPKTREIVDVLQPGKAFGLEVLNDEELPQVKVVAAKKTICLLIRVAYAKSLLITAEESRTESKSRTSIPSFLRAEIHSEHKGTFDLMERLASQLHNYEGGNELISIQSKSFLLTNQFSSDLQTQVTALSNPPDDMYITLEFQPAKALKPELDYFELEFVGGLGKGSFGEVFLVSEKATLGEETLYALKIVRRDAPTGRKLHYSKYLSEFNREKQSMSEISRHSPSPFIVKLYKTFADYDNVFYVMEYCQGGNLFQLCRSQKNFVLPQQWIQFFSASIVLGLEALHSQYIAFRDLKPGNLLLTSTGYLKLADFGLAKKTLRTYSFCGTAEYQSPEMICRTGHNLAVDYWALGVILFEVSMGFTPFVGETKPRLFQNIVNHRPRIITKSFIEKRLKRLHVYRAETNLPSPECIDLIDQLLHPTAAERLGYARNGVVDVKAHPYFKSINWDALQNEKLESPYQPQEPSKLEEGMKTKLNLREKYDPRLMPDVDDFLTHQTSEE